MGARDKHQHSKKKELSKPINAVKSHKVFKKNSQIEDPSFLSQEILSNKHKQLYNFGRFIL